MHESTTKVCEYGILIPVHRYDPIEQTKAALACVFIKNSAIVQIVCFCLSPTLYLEFEWFVAGTVEATAHVVAMTWFFFFFCI